MNRMGWLCEIPPCSTASPGRVTGYSPYIWALIYLFWWPCSPSQNCLLSTASFLCLQKSWVVQVSLYQKRKQMLGEAATQNRDPTLRPQKASGGWRWREPFLLLLWKWKCWEGACLEAEERNSQKGRWTCQGVGGRAQGRSRAICHLEPFPGVWPEQDKRDSLVVQAQ